MLCIQLRSMTYPNGYVALENVSLEFGDSGLYCLVGESGSGKSTLLQCISGMQEFDGDLFYDGKKLDGQDKIDFNRAYIAYVFQDFRLFDGLSVMDNVILGGEIAGNKISQDFARETINRVGLEKLADKKAKLLSGGERQRVAIARALAKNADVIIADEPTGNLDKRNSRAVMELLKDISKSKLVIVVTHDRKLSDEFGDRIIRLCDGKVVEIQDNSKNDMTKSSHGVKSQTAPISKKRIPIKSFFKLAFLRNYGSKLIATSALTLIVCLFAIFATTFAGHNKVSLAKRYFAWQKSDIARTEFMSENGQTVYIHADKDDSYSYYMRCSGWRVELTDVAESADFWQNDGNVGKIDFCTLSKGNLDSVKLLRGRYPQSLSEICLPIGVAKALDRNDWDGILDKKVKLNTGRTVKEFLIVGIFDNPLPDLPKKYVNMTKEQFISKGDDEQAEINELLSSRNESFLNRSVILSDGAIEDMLKISTAETYVGNKFSCKKGGVELVLYNATALGNEIAKGQALLSPAMNALASMLSASEYAQGIITFDVLGSTNEMAIAGVDNSLGAQYSIALCEEDYLEIVDTIDIKYAGAVFDYKDNDIAAVYKYFENKSGGMLCYISGNYMANEFIDSVKTVEGINIKIMLPIAVFFWIIGVLCMYITIKNAIVANEKNLAVMRSLGIGRGDYFAINLTGSAFYLTVILVVAALIVAFIYLVISKINFLLSLVAAFNGWEFLGLALAAIIALLCALLYLRKTMSAR